MVRQEQQDDAQRRRLARQLLGAERGDDATQVVHRLLAVQAQDLAGARLAIRARTRGLTVLDVDAALADRRLVVSWLCRGTLHLVTAADYWWLHPLTTPQLGTTVARRLHQEGVGGDQAERGIALVAEAVRRHGPHTRAQLRDVLDAAGVPTAGQALVYVLYAATLRGLLVRGPASGARDQAYVDPRTWLGPPPAPVPPERALARLGARYLAGHGPAGAADLVTWAGITLGAARRALPDVRPGQDGDQPHDPAPPLPPPRLLGPFDPILHGWADRSAIVGHHRGVVTSNGVFRPIALVQGRAVGTWSLAGNRVTLTLLEPVAPAALAALEAEAADVHRFMRWPQRPWRVAAGPGGTTVAG